MRAKHYFISDYTEWQKRNGIMNGTTDLNKNHVSVAERIYTLSVFVDLIIVSRICNGVRRVHKFRRVF